MGRVQGISKKPPETRQWEAITAARPSVTREDLVLPAPRTAEPAKQGPLEGSWDWEEIV